MRRSRGSDSCLEVVAITVVVVMMTLGSWKLHDILDRKPAPPKNPGPIASPLPEAPPDPRAKYRVYEDDGSVYCPRCEDFGQHPLRHSSVAHGPDIHADAGEHFDRTCERCGVQWIEVIR